MICPHCGSPAIKTDTGNDGMMYVAEDDEGGCTECYDGDISLFACQKDPKHIFYTDDGAGNSNN